MIEIICALIAGAASIIAATAELRTRKASKRAEMRAQRRAKESRLAMELMYATCSLALTNAKKLEGLHTNGDVEDAMTAADGAKNAYISFVRDEAAQNVAKL